MPRPNESIASSKLYEYYNTAAAHDLTADLGGKGSREIHVLAGGAVTLTRLDGTTVGPFTALAGQVLTLQATDVTLGAGAAILALG